MAHTATPQRSAVGRCPFSSGQGHGVILSVNFPAIVNPHVEVYAGWNQKYPEALYGGYVVGGVPKGGIPVGDVNLRLGCINYGNPAKATATVPGGVKVSTQTALLRADVSPATASVIVPRGACTRQPVPR